MTLVTSAADRTDVRAHHRALTLLPLTALTLDALVILVAGLVASQGRQHLGVFHTPADVTGSLGIAGPLMLVGWVVVVAVYGGYRPNVFGAGTDEYKRVMNASLVMAGLVGVGSYLAHFELARGFYVLAFTLGIPFLVLGRYLLRRALHTARRRGVLLQRVVIAGSSSHVDEIARVFRRERWLGYEVVGALTPPADTAEETHAGVPVLGNTDDVIAIVGAADIDVIFFAGGAVSSGHQMRRMVWELEHQRVQVVVAPGVTDISSERVRVRPVGGLPLMHIDPPTATEASRWGKRLFDMVGAMALIVAFAPLFLLAALRVKAHDRGPVLFRQTRVGKDGEAFNCLKFRSMDVDAEARLPHLHPEGGDTAGLFKMEDDPRVTKPGRWLRRYSLDELPQLVNVLRGEMSLVGPRPPLPREVKRYESDTHRRLRVRPGMTGLWQVSGRSDLAWAEAMRLDLYYVDNWSMLQDVNILAKTFGAVLRSRGAY